VFVLAALVRIWAVSSFATTPSADAADYHRLATNLVSGSGYVNEAGAATAWRPPGYPMFLAGIYFVFGPNVWAATVVQALLGAVTALLLVVLGWLLIGPREAIVAGFITAVYPSVVWVSRLLLSENLAVFLLLASLCVALVLVRSTRICWAAALGILLGFSVLVRGSNLLFALVVAAGIVIALAKRSINWKRIASIGILTAMGFVLTLLPWMIRNYRVFHAFVPVATQEGIGLYASYWPPVRNGKLIWGTLPGAEDPVVATAAQIGDEVSASRYLRQETLRRLRERPVYFFRLIPAKLISLFAPFDWEMFPHAEGRTRSVNYGYLLIILPGLFGFIAFWRERKPDTWLLWVLPVVVLIQAIVFYGSPRFRLPAELIALLWAGAGLSAAYAFLKSRLSLLGYKTNIR
jgi:4-amino-4-deoxy-L-arabinose transferase-like glycosyltransferase